jgi:hypothetical protein
MIEPSAFSAVLGWVIVLTTCYLIARAICYLAGDQWSDQ